MISQKKSKQTNKRKISNFTVNRDCSYKKSVGAKPSVTMLLHQSSHLCGLHTTQKFDKVHYYLYITTDSPSYKYKHCCLCSLLLVTKCYGTGECRLAIYCTDAIKIPTSNQSLLFFSSIVFQSWYSFSHKHLVNMVGINWNTAQMLPYLSFPPKLDRTITTFFLLHFIIGTTFLTSTS